MITLAIEWSSPQNSLALFRDRALLGQERWISNRQDHRTAFERMERLLSAAGLTAADVGRTVAGRGPGNYSGMRMALTLAETLLFPDGGECRALDSGAALARAALRVSGLAEIVVVGDARRGQVWWGAFDRDPAGALRQTAPWQLCRPEELPTRVPPSAGLVSPDLESLRARIPHPGGRGWRDTPRYPEAVELAQLAFEHIDAGRSFEAATPIYMHPAVG